MHAQKVEQNGLDWTAILILFSVCACVCVWASIAVFWQRVMLEPEIVCVFVTTALEKQS